MNSQPTSSASTLVELPTPVLMLIQPTGDDAKAVSFQLRDGLQYGSGVYSQHDGGLDENAGVPVKANNMLGLDNVQHPPQAVVEYTHQEVSVRAEAVAIYEAEMHHRAFLSHEERRVRIQNRVRQKLDNDPEVYAQQRARYLQAMRTTKAEQGTVEEDTANNSEVSAPSTIYTHVDGVPGDRLSPSSFTKHIFNQYSRVERQIGDVEASPSAGS